MKEFKSLLILLLLTCSMAATAQTTMKEAFKAYMQANPSATNFSPEILRNALEMMNAGLIKNYDETKSKQLVDNYLKEKFTDDAVDAMLPYMEEKLKVEEVNELTAKLSTDKGKSFVEHWSKINGNTSKFEQLGKEMAENDDEGYGIKVYSAARVGARLGQNGVIMLESDIMWLKTLNVGFMLNYFHPSGFHGGVFAAEKVGYGVNFGKTFSF